MPLPSAVAWLSLSECLSVIADNLDIEVGASDPKSILFVEEFAVALHAVGAELSADIGNCGGADSMGNTCEDYRASSIDRVFTMSTYPW